MAEDRKVIPGASAPQIRIERLNTDKTRKVIGSDTVYHVCFELSGTPPAEWRIMFGKELKKVNPALEADIDGSFLMLQCPLHDVAGARLQSLKKAVASTNEAFRHFAQEQATALEAREDVWKQEREDVDSMATSLHFE